MKLKISIELNSVQLESFEVEIPAYDAGVLVAQIENLFLGREKTGEQKT